MSRRLGIALAVLAAAIIGSLAWQVPRSRQPQPVYLSAKPESFWIDRLDDRRCGIDALTEEWRPLGSQAVPVLVKALGKTSTPLQNLHRKLWPHLPLAVRSWFKSPPDDPAPIRGAAAYIMGELPCEIRSAAPALIRAINDKDPGVRMNAAASLGRIGLENADLRPALVKAMKNPDRMVRDNMCVSLGRCQAPSDVIPCLKRALEDPDGLVRVKAVVALHRFYPQTAAQLDRVTILLKCAREQDWRTRICAIKALGELGNQAGAAVPDLRKATRDQDTQIREAATRAIQQIVPEGSATPMVRGNR